ncbi:helix-turn-helix domain-containing protein [Gimesia sp.]|uniref:helix-turn-helix domain-containing protein n=1 Tax=Gimesia sp. TaxID=2024833 RepID=UPI0025B80478|nr:helix-turn-helix domain-containing protein [Gimesia sp.]
MTTRQRKPLFERIKQGLEEGIAHTTGELTLKTVEIPNDPPEIDAKTLSALRTRAGMSQAVFARMLSVSTKTLQSWEQGLRDPSAASRRLIQMFSEHPELVCKSVGLPSITLKGVKVKGKRIVVNRHQAKVKSKSK